MGQVRGSRWPAQALGTRDRPARAVQVPTITAVIPTFNRVATLRRSLRSVLDQSSPVDAIIVVDDGSTDDTLGIIREFGDSVRLIRQPHAGAAAARNRGVFEADTDWVAFLDSDDYWESGHIERIRAAIDATDGVAMFYFADMYLPEGASLFELCGFQAPSPFQITGDATDWVMRSRQPTMLQASVIRRTRYCELNGMRAELRSRHDTHLFFLLGVGQPACAVPHCGTIMTEDAAGGRVTELIGPVSELYWRETAVMYQDILRAFPRLPAQHRMELRERLSAAHLRLANFAQRPFYPIAFTWHVARALACSPRRLFAAIRRRIRGS